MKKWLLLISLMASPAMAQDASLVEGFAEGFTFHSLFATGHKVEADGSVVYANNDSHNTHLSSVRQGAAPCVFISTSLNLNEGATGTPVVMLEDTYDLRGASFEANPKHEFAPPGGVYLIMRGPRIQCHIMTAGSDGKLQRTSQCEDRFEATIEQSMMPAFKTASARLRSFCNWK